MSQERALSPKLHLGSQRPIYRFQKFRAPLNQRLYSLHSVCGKITLHRLNPRRNLQVRWSHRKLRIQSDKAQPVDTVKAPSVKVTKTSEQINK